MDLFILSTIICLPFVVTWLVLASLFFVPTLRQLAMLRKLTGPWFVPVIGPIHFLPFVDIKDALSWLSWLFVDGWNRVAAFWVLGLPYVVVNSPDDIEVILSSTRHIEKGWEYDLLKPWLQQGLLTSTGQKWRSRRKILTPTFHFKILEDKSQTMYVNARKFVERLLQENEKPFSPYEKISCCTLDVISEAAMGVSLNSQDDHSTEYVAAIGRVTIDVVYRVVYVYYTAQWLWELTARGVQNMKDIKFLHDFTSKIITERRAVYSKARNENKIEDIFGEKKRQAFLDRILELDLMNEGEWTDDDIREEVDTFLFEGHDTTAALIQYAMFELGHNPEIQELAYQEQFEIFNNEQRDATMADLQNMHYLERFIKECLRLYPSVPYISRRLNEDLQLKDLPPTPAGSNIVILPYFVHRNPEHFPDPEKFDPDRFLPDECAKRHPFVYIPFSAGPRNCIGQKFAMLEIKVLLSTLIRFSRVESVTTRAQLNLVPFTILRPSEPIQVKVLRR